MDNPRAPILAAAGVVVAAIVLVFVLVLPKMAQVSRAKDDLAAAAAQQQTLEAQKGALEDLQAKAGENKAIIKDVKEKIPPTADESGLLLLINNAATGAGLDLSTIAPNQPTFDETTGLSTIVIAMSATGSYNEVTTFTYKIETLPQGGQDHLDGADGRRRVRLARQSDPHGDVPDQRLHERRERRSGIDAGTDRGGWLRWR